MYVQRIPLQLLTFPVVWLTYKIDDFLADSACTSIMNPNIYGYNTLSKPESFSLVFDIRTLITAIAVNYGYTSLDTLVAIPNTSFNFTTFGTYVEAGWYYDPRYPGMAPISCTSNSPVRRAICIIGIGKTPAFPFMLHSGMNNSGIPEPCSCPSLTTEDLMNPYHPCHRFAFRYGFMHWNTANPSPLFEFAQHILLDPSYMDNMFNATALSTPVWSESPAYANDLNSSAYREAQFSYCNTSSYGYCRVFVINAFDLFNTGFTVSPNYYQLIRGACRDSISVTTSVWDKLISTPFAPLVQEYQKCRYSVSYAISNNLGVTLGNLSVYTPACILVLGLLVWLYKHSGFYTPPPHESYTSRDREEAVEALAVAMLMIRDGRYDQTLKQQVSSLSAASSTVQLKVLEDLVKELQQHAEETSSYNNGQSMGFLVHSKCQTTAAAVDMSDKGSAVDDGSEGDDNQIAMIDVQDMLELQPQQLQADEEKRSEHKGVAIVEEENSSNIDV